MENLDILLQYKIFDISILNILIALLILFCCSILRVFFSNIILSILRKLASKTKSTVDDKLISALESPFRFSFIILGFYLSNEWLDLDKYQFFINNLTQTMIVFAIFWTAMRLVNEFNAVIALFSSRLGKPINIDIENFIIKSCKVLIVILGFLMILQTWGVNITAFIASLGLGGLAFALAAKDTAANLFGSLVIFADRPFKVGDYVELNGIEGSVEEIGIRSTRIRTTLRSLVTVPNAVVANAAIANWSKRRRRKSEFYIGLTYDTSLKQIQNITKQIEQYLILHEQISEDNIIVLFENYGDSSLNIMCSFYANIVSRKEFLHVQQDVNFAIMDIVEKNNSSFAFPTQSLYIEKNKSE